MENQTGSVDQNTDPGQSNSAGEEEAGFEMDMGSIAFIAMLLLFNVGIVAAIMAIRSKSKKKGDGRERAMAAFERDLFAETGPVTSVPVAPEVATTPEPVLNSNAPPLPAEGLPPGWTTEQWNHYGAQWLAQQAPTVPIAEPAPVPTVTPTVPDLPSIEDLLG